MQVFLNGQFVSEDQAVVSVFDRCFLYGDGLFEAMLIHNGKPFRWAQHLERLQRGAEFLKIQLPYSSDALRNFADELIARNKMPDALLRLTVSRGVGIRGYSPKGADRPTVVMSLHPAAPISAKNDRWKLITASVRLPAGEALAQFKTCNKLSQVMARAEADAAGADEALLLNTDGVVVEASSSNLFWVEDNTVCTPPLASGILAGVTRAVILELCDSLKLKTLETNVTPAQLRKTQGVFVSLTSRGLVEAESLDGTALPGVLLTEKLRQAFGNLVQRETA